MPRRRCGAAAPRCRRDERASRASCASDRHAASEPAGSAALVEFPRPACKQEESGREPSRAADDRSRHPGGSACRDIRRVGGPAFAARADLPPGARALADRRGRLSAYLGRCRAPAARGAFRRPALAQPRAARAPARPARGSAAGSSRYRSRARAARAARPGAARADEARTWALQVRATAGARARPGRLRGVGGSPATRIDRDARRLVGAHALVRLSVSTGVAPQARPRSAEERSIAASVRR